MHQNRHANYRYLPTSTSEPKLRHFSLTRRNPKLSICVTESDAGNKLIIIMSNQSTTWPCWMSLNLTCTPSTQAQTLQPHQPSRNIFKTTVQEKHFLTLCREQISIPTCEAKLATSVLSKNNSVCLDCLSNYQFSVYALNIWT